MSHDIELEIAAKKSAQLNALLFEMNTIRLPDSPSVEELIGLSLELSGSVAIWLIEENEKRKQQCQK